MSLCTTIIDSAAAWRGARLAARNDFRIVLGRDQIEQLDRAIAVARSRGFAGDGNYLQIETDDFPLPALGDVINAIRCTMISGSGAMVLQGLPVQRWGEQDTRLALWGLGRHLGWAEPQDGAGALMHDVRDVGRPFGSDSTIRYFQTNQAIEFHNDGADMFALCCLRGGRSGGMSRIVSAVEVFNQILIRRPDLATVLQQDFHVDARGQRTDGARCQVIPVFAVEQGHLTILLKRAYIDSAQRFDDVPRLRADQVEALEMLNAVMEEPGMALEFQLEPGEILIGSNHVMLHGRTAIEDAGPAEPRHMLRLWLTVPGGPPLPAHYANTREFAATYARRM